MEEMHNDKTKNNEGEVLRGKTVYLCLLIRQTLRQILQAQITACVPSF